MAGDTASLLLWLLYAEIQSERTDGKYEQHDERRGITVGRSAQAVADTGDQCGTDQIEVCNAVVDGEIFLTVKLRGKGRGDRGARAVGQTGQAKTDDAERQRGHLYCEECHG